MDTRSSESVFYTATKKSGDVTGYVLVAAAGTEGNPYVSTVVYVVYAVYGKIDRASDFFSLPNANALFFSA